MYCITQSPDHQPLVDAAHPMQIYIAMQFPLDAAHPMHYYIAMQLLVGAVDPMQIYIAMMVYLEALGLTCFQTCSRAPVSKGRMGSNSYKQSYKRQLL